MNLEGRRYGLRPALAAGSTWDWEAEISAAIAMVARDRRYRVVLCGRALRASVVAKLDAAALGAGVVLERRIRQGGGWDVEVHAA